MPIFTWPITPSTIPTPPSGRLVSFLGKGLLSPLREDSVTGDFQRVSDENNVRQCMKDGILTAINERVMLEPLGTIARDLLFEDSQVISDLLEPSVKDFITQFEPRVVLDTVRVEPIEISADLAAFRVGIIYRVRATNRRENLVFPFYLTNEQFQRG